MAAGGAREDPRGGRGREALKASRTMLARARGLRPPAVRAPRQGRHEVLRRAFQSSQQRAAWNTGHKAACPGAAAAAAATKAAKSSSTGGQVMGSECRYLGRQEGGGDCCRASAPAVIGWRWPSSPRADGAKPANCGRTSAARVVPLHLSSSEMAAFRLQSPSAVVLLSYLPNDAIPLRSSDLSPYPGSSWSLHIRATSRIVQAARL